MLDFSALNTPAHDGDLLIAPHPPRLAQLLEENRRRIEQWDTPVLDVTLRELRRRVREQLLGNTDAPLVMTGHQPDFIHPGVWAKHAVARLVADQTGATALNLVVDQDTPKDTALVIPAQRDANLQLGRMAYAEATQERPFERIPALTGEALRCFAGSIRDALGEAFAASFMPAYLQAFSAAADSGGGLVGQILAGRRAIDTSLGVAYENRRVSKVWSQWQAADLMLNAARFVRAYNEALAAYRRQLNIKSPSRPIPDLQQDGERLELPLWAYGRDSTRRRVWVKPDPAGIEVFAERDSLGRVRVGDLGRTESAAQAIQENLSAPLRPRALTLMLWARLFACDLFIHGIGGAKYDRITDGIIERYYRVSPPAYACASATLHLPLPRQAVTAADLREARRRARDVHHNPQRYLDPHPQRAALESAAAEAVRQAQALRAGQPRNHVARREAFRQIRRLKADLLALQPGLAEMLSSRGRDIEAQLAHNRIATGREYFVGLYPREKVAGLADAIRARGA